MTQTIINSLTTIILSILFPIAPVEWATAKRIPCHLKFSVVCIYVKGMSVVVNVMLSLMSVMSPPHALCNLSVHTVVKLCMCFCFRGELGFLSCDDICMCVVNKQFELIEFVFDSVYVDLQYE